MIIYRMRNKNNGKCYVGQTIQKLTERVYDHSRENSVIGQALRKYGREGFAVSVLQRCGTPEELDEAERYWIRKLRTLAPEGYNVHPGGVHGGKLTEAHRKKIGDSLRGRKRSKQTCKRISQALKGRVMDPEWRAKISKAAKGRKATPAMLKALQKRRGRPQSDAERVLHSKNNGHRRLSDEDVRDIRENSEDESQQILADRYGVTQCHISRIQRRVAFSWIKDED